MATEFFSAPVTSDMSGQTPQTMRAWIEREFTLDGVLAAGGGSAGAPPFSAIASGEFVLAHDENVWRCLAETLENLRAHGAPTREMLWGFENAVLCTIRRDDGAWLGVFTAPRLGDESALAVRAKLDAFKQQNFAAPV